MDKDSFYKKIKLGEMIDSDLLTRIHSSDGIRIWYSYITDDSDINRCLYNMKNVGRSERIAYSLFAYEYCLEDKLPLIMTSVKDEKFNIKTFNLHEKNYFKDNLDGPSLDKIVETILMSENTFVQNNK